MHNQSVETLRKRQTNTDFGSRQAIQQLNNIQNNVGSSVDIIRPSEGSNSNLILLPPANQSKFANLFRFADRKDVFLMILGTIGSIMVGVLQVMIFFFQGRMYSNYELPRDQLMTNTISGYYYFIGTATLHLITGFLMYFGWIISGYRRAQKCRSQYLEAVFRQEIGWFETQDQSKIFTQFTSDCNKFEQAISEKMAIFLFILSTFITRILISLIVVWQLALVLFCLILIIGVVFIATQFIDRNCRSKVDSRTIHAIARAEQVLSCVETVKALNGEQFESSNFAKSLQMVKQQEFKLGLSNGLSSGIMFFTVFCLFALGLYYGLYLISVQTTNTYSQTGFVTVGNIYVPIFVLAVALFIVLQFKSSLQDIKEGMQALSRIVDVIDRKKIDRQEFFSQGIIPYRFQGHFQLQNVSFSYPSKPDHQVLNKVTIDFNKNNHALVGFSGSGKSTIFQLLIRLYQPTEGAIYLDGVNIKQINVKWLRSQIGYVTQEAFFFTGTLRQNFLVCNLEAKDQQIFEALKVAEIFHTVQALKDKLDTKISINANQFSGGQRQRLSIAKALIKNPKLLLLDQPTSSLDRKTQFDVQNNLDKITKRIKSISIVHRVQTIKNCDKIIFMKEGKVVQEGRYQDLIKFNTEINRSQINIPRNPKNEKLKPSQLQSSSELSDQQQIGVQTQQDKKQDKKQQKQYSGSIYLRIFSFLNKKLALLIIAFILCIVIGFVPSFIGRLTGISLSAGIQLSGQLLSQVSNQQSLILFILGFVFFIAKFFQSFLLTYCGAQLTYQLRMRVYQKILGMPVAWFDQKSNSVTNLTSFLDKDCQNIQNLVTVSIGIVIQVIAVGLASLIISFSYEYRVTLVLLAVIPAIVMIDLVQVQVNGKISKQVESVDEDSNSLLRQSIVHAKIIISNNFENMVINKYTKNIYGPLSSIVKKGIYTGVLFGISVFLSDLIVGAQYFVITAVFIQNSSIELVNVIAPGFVLDICFNFMTYLFHFMPDIGNARRSAVKAFNILDQCDQLQMQKRQKSRMLPLNSKQFKQIQLKNVTFRYPNRTENIFQNANLKIVKGTHYDIIGRSGCGKSTIFKILLRFYEPTKESQIIINGINIKQYDIKQLRGLFGFVSQQAIMFAGTIKQNIHYNTNGKDILEIQQAARISSSLQFIEGQNIQNMINPGKVRMIHRNTFKQDRQLRNSGYLKEVGIKGNQLSGGQRQRISIARALLRNAELYLFDESTSALDQRTQLIIQQNIKAVLNGKTSLSITHNFKQHQGKSVIVIENKGFSVINPKLIQRI